MHDFHRFPILDDPPAHRLPAAVSSPRASCVSAPHAIESSQSGKRNISCRSDIVERETHLPLSFVDNSSLCPNSDLTHSSPGSSGSGSRELELAADDVDDVDGQSVHVLRRSARLCRKKRQGAVIG